jgi:hypothetical protein
VLLSLSDNLGTFATIGVRAVSQELLFDSTRYFFFFGKLIGNIFTSDVVVSRSEKYRDF